MADNLYQYYVEGENEEKVVNSLKSELRCIRTGKVAVFDVVKRRITRNKLRQLKRNTIVVLVFDTDTDNAEILNENIEFIRKQNYIKDVICVTQVQNLEDEIERSCNIKMAKQLTGSRSLEDYKRDLNAEKNLGTKLRNAEFDIDKFWSMSPSGAFEKIPNEATKIKI